MDPHALRRGLCTTETRIARVGAVAIVLGMTLTAIAPALRAAAPWVAFYGAALAIGGSLLTGAAYRSGRLVYTACMALAIGTAGVVVLALRTNGSAAALSWVLTLAATTLWVLWDPRARKIFDPRWASVRAVTPDIRLGTGWLETLGWFVAVGLSGGTPFILALLLRP